MTYEEFAGWVDLPPEPDEDREYEEARQKDVDND